MLNIAIIGIGGAGENILEEVYKKLQHSSQFEDKINIKYAVISPNLEDIHRIQYLTDVANNTNIYEPIINRTITYPVDYMAIGDKTCNGLSASGDPKKGLEAYTESEKNVEIFLNNFLKNANLSFTIAGIGGGTGTGVTPKVNEYIKNCLKIPVVTVCTKPFKWEGKKRAEVYNEYFKMFKETSNEIYCIDTDKIFNKAKEKFSMAKQLHMVEENGMGYIFKCLEEKCNKEG